MGSSSFTVLLTLSHVRITLHSRKHGGLTAERGGPNGSDLAGPEKEQKDRTEDTMGCLCARRQGLL